MSTSLIVLATVAMLAQAGMNTRSVSARLANASLAPTVLSQVLPDTPASEAAAPRTDVDVEVVIGANGAVAHARVAASDPKRALREQAALDAARRWRFRAAIGSEGFPIATLAIIRMTFEPSSSSGEPARTRASLRWIEPLPATPRNRAPESAVIYSSDAKGVREPVLIREVAPDYTIDAMRAKIQGVVVMDIVVMADGTVGYGTVTKRLDDGLDKQALIAARHWLFQPAFFEGRPVAFSVTLVLEFRLH